MRRRSDSARRAGGAGAAATPPRRPRLADHASARRHLADGEERVVLHDARTGRLLVLGPREWALLACADGTRDLDGIVAAAAREGAHARAPALGAFLAQLHSVGLLAEGTGAEAASGSEAPSTRRPQAARPPPAPATAADERPLDLLPGFSLRCDGAGSCCRIYATILFSPLEAAQARAALPAILDGGARPTRAFLPERGAGPCAGAAVAMIDGRCAYLTPSGRCAVHEAAGEGAKPLGCRLFPTTLADDGEAVRVSVAVECACVLASAGQGGGSPLLPGAPRVRGDLDPAAHVADVPAQITLRPGVVAPRSALATWSRRVVAAAERGAGAARGGAAAALWALAAAVDARGLDPDAAAAALAGEGAAPAPRDLAPWLEAIAGRAGRRAAEDDAWRGERDLARVATRRIAAAAEALRSPGVLAAAVAEPPDGVAAGEALYLRAGIHGHHLVGDAPLATALRDRAARVVLSRAMRSVEAGRIDDPAMAQPLALVEAMMRGHGLDAYVHDAAP